MTKDLETLARKMTTESDFNILSVDMSLRHAGVCVVNKSNKIVLEEALDLRTFKPEGQGKFRSLELEVHALNRTMAEIGKININYKPKAILVEFPAFSQTATSAVTIGMAWAAWSEYFKLPYFVAVEPSALKIWSGSKRGDHKEKVKEKVMSRTWLPEKKANNDNIIDAVGLAFLFCDLIHELSNSTTHRKGPEGPPFRLTP